LTEPDIFSEPRRQADPVYRHLLIPVGLGCGHGHHAADRQRGLPLPWNAKGAAVELTR
jgi:hypothetical protein